MRVGTPLCRGARPALAAIALAAACCIDTSGPGVRLSVEPDTLFLTARQGGLPPVERYFTVSATGQVPWTAGTDVPWLSLTPSSGGILQSVLVVADPRGLELGTHDATVTVSAPRASNSTVRAVVRLEMVAEAPLTGRWLGASGVVVLLVDLRETSGVVTGTGRLAESGASVTVTGTRSGDTIALSLQRSGEGPLTLGGFFYTDHIIRSRLTGPGFPGDSVNLFRQ